LQDFEIIVVDDGSTDNTRDVIAPYLDQGRIFYYYQQNRGVGNARNFGVRQSNGKFVVFLDSDDEALTHWLERFHEASGSGFDVVCCGVYAVSGTKKVLKLPVKGKHILPNTERLFLAGSYCVRKDLFEKIGGFDEMMWYGENAELSYRLLRSDIKIASVHHALLLYNQSFSEGSKNLKNKILGNLHSLRKHLDYLRQFPELLSKQYYIIARDCVLQNQKERARLFFYLSWKSNPFFFKALIKYMDLSWNRRFIAR
jgi:glycosyltransferase involved in cell wall biosynthesis